MLTTAAESTSGHFTDRFLVGAEIEMARLESEKTSLSEELETRRLVERAKGILQGELRLNEEEAYLALRRESRQKRVSMNIYLSPQITKRP